MVSHGIKLAQKLGAAPRRVLVVQKRTRLVREMLRHPCYLENLATVGRHEDGVAVKTRHDVHEANLSVILNELKKYFEEVVLVDTVTKSLLDWADMFISAGGDGTFLNVAAQLNGGQMLIGLNTDPERSMGHLCARSRYTTNVRHIIKGLAERECTFIKRSRIRVKLSYPCIGEDSEVEVYKYALNDIYIGETSPTQMSYIELVIDGMPAEKQKTSGLVICTGSGSTAWGYHVNALDHYRADKLASILLDMGVVDKKLKNSVINSIMKRFNESFTFQAHDRRMKYITREPLQNNVFKAVNTQGYATRITARSLCWNGKIVMDGMQRKFNFDDGVIANFSINDEDSIDSVQYID